MGGNAFLIRGKLAEASLHPEPIERTLMDRIMGRQRFYKPEVMDLGGGRRMIELPADKYRVLAEDFRHYLRKRVSQPWPATRVFLDYLRGGVLSVFVRGEQNPEVSSPEYYIQITFSGCAGTAEVSAELGTHWAETYYAESHERIKEEYLNHFGFAPDDAGMAETFPRQFLPLGKLGYAMYVGGGPGSTDPEWEGSRLFELDAGLSDSFYERGELSALRELDTRYGPLMADGKCRCQLCMPELDPSSLGDLPFSDA
ncbi:MAG: hypothetical protein RDU20_12625 [Desulfomonilaceae bacterium]|nr:hypothetical protein [Desulfomonilaceae bacterium]